MWRGIGRLLCGFVFAIGLLACFGMELQCGLWVLAGIGCLAFMASGLVVGWTIAGWWN